MADHRSDMPGRGGRFLVPGLAVAAGVVLACVPARAQDFTMKFATQTLNDMQHEYIKVYKTELEKATNNRIKVEVYPASQLGGAQRQTEGLRLGTIEAAIGPVELFVGADQRLQVPALAGLYKDRAHLQRVVEVPAFRQAIFDVGAARGMVGLSLDAYDMQSFVFKVPVTTVAGFAGKRIRVLASDGEQSAVAALGGSGVPMSLPEVLPALQQGTIDGVNSVLGVFVAFRYYDAAPQHGGHGALAHPLGRVRQQGLVRPAAAGPEEDRAGDRLEDRAGAVEMADRAHRCRHQGVDRQGRQDHQALGPG